VYQLAAVPFWNRADRFAVEPSQSSSRTDTIDQAVVWLHVPVDLAGGRTKNVGCRRLPCWVT